MKDDKKPDLKLVKKEPDLTIKQRAFVNEIVKGKLGSYKEAYAKVYDVKLTKTGKLVSNPKISISIQKAIERKERSVIASSLRTRNYVIDQLYKESQDSQSDSSRVRALELLGKSVSLFTDVVESKESRPVDEIESEIEDRLSELLEASNSE